MRETVVDEVPGFHLGAGDPRFSVRSATATSVTLMVDGRGSFPLTRTGDVWAADAQGVEPGDSYHLLVDGPAGPRHEFDAARPLLDPAARGIVRAEDVATDGSRPTARWTSVVVNDSFDWGGVVKPRTPLDRTLVYEANVRTLTAANHHLPEDLRGTYAGIAHESTIAHLHRLGVTTLELLPVHAFDTEHWLQDAGRENAWGYNTLGFSAPHAAYASPGARAEGASAVLREFKGMVRLLHEAGIQVVLDVVYNHTAEEGLGGPTSSLRGIDGANRYRWVPSDGEGDADADADGRGGGEGDNAARADGNDSSSDGNGADGDGPVDREFDRNDDVDRDGSGGRSATGAVARASYYDTTGCGNTLDTSVEATADLIVDSLVYWAREVQVDGFRFDLMAALARDAHHVFDPSHPLLERIRNHPDLQDTVVIAEPWDVGPDGWRTGSFGAAGERTSEWNDGFRNTVRQFWLTDIAEERRNGAPATGIGALAGALTGSRHLFGAARGPLAGINFVTAHDGFTLLDLVSYDGKHNEANGEENRDGSNDNRSFNHGIEGDTADRGVRAARGRSMRNLLGTLMLSAGVPMLTAGDERSRTQHGNNNAYVVSGDLTPVDWSDHEDTEAMTEVVATLARLRAAHPALRPTRFGVEGQETPGASRMSWYGPDGHPMTLEGWDQPIHRALQYFVESTPEHEPFDRVLVVVHGSGRTRDLTLPVRDDVLGYRLVWSSEKHRDHERLRPAGQVFTAYGPGIHVFEIA